MTIMSFYIQKKILIFTKWLRLHQFFSHLNFKNISILNGGYPDFKKKFDLFIEEGEFKVKPNTSYKAQINRNIIANSNDIIESRKNNYQL